MYNGLSDYDFIDVRKPREAKDLGIEFNFSIAFRSEKVNAKVSS